MPDTDKFSDQEILARTIYGESRGESHEGKQAVACVVLNRVKSGVRWWGTDIRSVCLKPFQFSCWLARDPNRAVIMAVEDDEPIFAECLGIARDAMSGDLSDVTDGATSYKVVGTPAAWATGKTPLITIGAHEFYKI